MFSSVGPVLSQLSPLPSATRLARPERGRGRAHVGGPLASFPASVLQHAQAGRNAPSRVWAFVGRGRVWRQRSYQQRFQQTMESIISRNLVIQPGAEVDTALQSRQQALLAFLVGRARGGFPEHVRAAVATISTLLNGRWTEEAITSVPQDAGEGTCACLFPSPGPAAGPGQAGHFVREVGPPDWPGSAGPIRLPSPCPSEVRCHGRGAGAPAAWDREGEGGCGERTDSGPAGRDCLAAASGQRVAVGHDPALRGRPGCPHFASPVGPACFSQGLAGVAGP